MSFQKDPYKLPCKHLPLCYYWLKTDPSPVVQHENMMKNYKTKIIAKKMQNSK